jgi:hypothetical protein
MSNIKRGRGRPLSPVTVSLGKLKVGEELVLKATSEPVVRATVYRAAKRFDRAFVCTKVKTFVFKIIRQRKARAA